MRHTQKSGSAAPKAPGHPAQRRPRAPGTTRRVLLKAGAAATVSARLGLAAAAASPPASGAPKPFQMRFAICNETFRDIPLEKAFATAAECGYQGVEIAPFTMADRVTDIPAARRQEVRKQAEKAGLQVVGLHWLLAKTKGFHLTSPDRPVRRATADYLIALGRFCADLGGGVMVFGSPDQRKLLPDVSRPDAASYAAEVLRAALPELEKAGVTVAMEPLSPKTVDFLTTAAEAVKLIEMVASDRCRLILDCVAMTEGEAKPIPDVIRQHKAHLAHLHANDPNKQGPGFGKLDFVPILRALREIDYKGWVSVEVFDYTPGPTRLVKESIDYLRRCLAQVR